MTYFDSVRMAQLYARRPYFHPVVIESVKTALNLRSPVHRAVDVGCGTGHSTKAAKGIACDLVGTDVSLPMLAEAPRLPRVHYVQATAESLPFAAEMADLITVASAFHWFDRAAFLRDASRVLGPASWLVIYDNGFFGKMRENPNFERWSQEQYITRYPSPPRNRRPLAERDAEIRGFGVVGRERYTNDVCFSVDDLVGYLMT